MPWWGNKKAGIDQDNWIEVGDCVTFKEAYPNLDKYFIHGPLEVIRIDDGPEYAGGKFITCKYGYGETGFYLNAVKKVKCS